MPIAEYRRELRANLDRLFAASGQGRYSMSRTRGVLLSASVLLISAATPVCRAEVLFEWVTLSYPSRYGGLIHDRNLPSVSGTREEVDAAYNAMKGAVGHNNVTARGFALRCSTSDGLGWYGSLRSAHHKDGQKTSYGYVKTSEAGSSMVVCGAPTLSAAVDLLVDQCEKDAQCVSQPFIGVAVRFDMDSMGTVSRFECGGNSASELRNDCVQKVNEMRAQAETESAAVLSLTKSRLSTRMKWAVIAAGPNPAVVDVFEKRFQGRAAVLNSDATRAARGANRTTQAPPSSELRAAPPATAPTSPTSFDPRLLPDRSPDPEISGLVIVKISPECTIRATARAVQMGEFRSPATWQGPCKDGFIDGHGTLTTRFDTTTSEMTGVIRKGLRDGDYRYRSRTLTADGKELSSTGRASYDTGRFTGSD